MNRQKGIAPILIIILIAVAVGGYLIYQTQTKPVVVPQVIQPSSAPVSTSSATSSAETANWKTYTNTKYGFSIQYPSDLIITSEGYSSPGIEWGISWSKKSKEGMAQHGLGWVDYTLGIQIQNNATNRKEQKIVSENFEESIMDMVSANESKPEKIQFDNRPAYKFYISFRPNGGSRYYYILDGNRLIYLAGTSDDLSRFSLSSIDQILSTFKFTQ